MKVGDEVVRVLCGDIHMPLVVTEITDTLIVCGPWTFSRRNGAEIDEELGWDEGGTGSYLMLDGV